jgi:hypothetical protein
MQVIAVPQTLFLIFTIAVVICLIIQAGVFLGLYLIARTAAAKAEKISLDLNVRAMPILAQVRGIAEDLSPKLRVISSNLVEISNTLKDQTRHVNTTVGEVVDKTRVQADRVDEMVSAILDGVTHAGATIQAGVSKPVRQVNGIFQGLRAGLEYWFTKSKPVRPYSNGTVAEESRAHVVSETTDF